MASRFCCVMAFELSRSVSNPVAQFAQPFKGVDATLVAVAPDDVECVASDRLDPNRMNVLGDLAGIQLVLSRPFINTDRAVAGKPQIPDRVLALYLVRPENFQRLGAGLADFDRSRSVLVCHPIKIDAVPEIGDARRRAIRH